MHSKVGLVIPKHHNPFRSSRADERHRFDRVLIAALVNLGQGDLGLKRVCMPSAEF